MSEKVEKNRNLFVLVYPGFKRFIRAFIDTIRREERSQM